MATLYVEGIPKELYEALRAQARRRRRSIAAEILSLLEDNVPTEKDLKARHSLLKRLEKARTTKETAAGQFPSTEEMQREDRSR
jgi:plasmid stability protein